MKELIEELRHLSVMGNALKDEYIAQTCTKAIAALEAAEYRELERRNAELVEALNDAVSGLRCIEQQHGRLYGVGWDRVYDKHAALTHSAQEQADAAE